MSLRVPLTVRIKTNRTDRHITPELRNLQFRSAAPGGFASATMSLHRPLSLQPDEVVPYGEVFVYDTRNGNTVWEGRLEDPGRSAGPGGQVYDLAAVGPSAHAQDVTKPYVAIDRSHEGWARSHFSWRSYQLSQSERTSEVPSLLVEAPEGTSVDGLDTLADWHYTSLYESGQKLGRISCSVDGAANSSNFGWKLMTRITPTGGGTQRDGGNLSTTAATLLARRGTEFTTADDVCNLRLQHITSSTPIGPSAVAEFYNIVVRAVLKNSSGDDITTGYTVTTVLASQVVTDVVARFCPKYDLANASISTTTYGIEQLAFPDGANAQQIFEDIMLLEAAYTWAAWESEPVLLPAGATNGHRFEFKPWPTVNPRYQVDTIEEFDSPGSSDGLYNAVRVRYKDARGKVRTRRRSQTVQALTDAGLSREAFIDLGDNLGSAADADRVGDQFLAEHAAPPNAGTLTVTRPVRDLTTGRLVDPWELRAGELIKVTGVKPSQDSLNANTRDGVTTFRMVEADFDSATGSARLALDTYPVTVSRALAKLAKNRITRRR